MSNGQDNPWRFVNFDEVLTEWAERDDPTDQLELTVAQMLISLFDSLPDTWLARRTPCGWPEAWLGVMHLGSTDLTLGYVEDRGERVATALSLARS